MNKYEHLGRVIIEKGLARREKDFERFTVMINEEQRLTKELENAPKDSQLLSKSEISGEM